MEEAKNKPSRLIRRPVVIDRTGLQTTQIYDLIAADKFPAPVAIGARAVAWVESEVDAWIEERIRDRTKSIQRSGSIRKPRQERAAA
jgi:prophage regulatory protein